MDVLYGPASILHLLAAVAREDRNTTHANPRDRRYDLLTIAPASVKLLGRYGEVLGWGQGAAQQYRKAIISLARSVRDLRAPERKSCQASEPHMQRVNEGAADSMTISLLTYTEIMTWCGKFECSEIQLAEAVATVGYSSDAVRQYLARRATPEAPT